LYRLQKAWLAVSMKAAQAGEFALGLAREDRNAILFEESF
jgi:hypothetical protein